MNNFDSVEGLKRARMLVLKVLLFLVILLELFDYRQLSFWLDSLDELVVEVAPGRLADESAGEEVWERLGGWGRDLGAEVHFFQAFVGGVAREADAHVELEQHWQQGQELEGSDNLQWLYRLMYQV